MSDTNDLLTTLLESASIKNKDGSYNKLKPPSKSMEVEDLDFGTEEEISGVQSASSIDEILSKAIDNRASDIHISAGVPPRYRINGELKDIRGYATLTPDDTMKLLSSTMDEASRKQFEEDGDLDYAYAIRNIGRFRANVYRQRGTCAGVFRILSNNIPSPEKLGLPDSVVQLAGKKRGLVLVTGATGSGKSTTLASIINLINENYAKNIITLEDPIEYLHKHKKSNVNQREIGTDSKNFSSALRSALREDPDVILIGEMRDFETISIAMTAAETGHLVFSTLHTIGAPATIDRIVDTFPEKQQGQARSQLSSVLIGVVSQQLVPLIDKRGRVAAFEIMLDSTAIKNLIREGKTEQIASSMQTSGKAGMVLMDDYLLGLVKDGKISTSSALEFSVNKASMAERIGRKG